MSTTLMHYGVKGMKWGVRRSESQLATSRSKAEKNADKIVKTKRKKDVKNRRTLTTEELKSKIDRMKLEKQFKDLTEEDISPGRKVAKDILKSAGTKVLSAAAAGAAAYAVKAAMTKRFDLGEAAAYIAANPNKKK